MSDLYQASAGSIIKSNLGTSSFITVDGMSSLIQGGRMLLTSLKIDRGQGFQIVKTLGNLYYIYAFGEMPGKVMVGGLLFFTDCSSSTNGQIISDINSYYDQFNLYNYQKSVVIAAGTASFNCLLTNLSVSADMSPYNFASFSLAFTLLPPRQSQ